MTATQRRDGGGDIEHVKSGVKITLACDVRADDSQLPCRQPTLKLAPPLDSMRALLALARTGCGIDTALTGRKKSRLRGARQRAYVTSII